MVHSLAQAYAEPWWTPLAIYADEIPVGFVMYRQLPGTDIAWIQRIMIDARSQHKGYGRVAMEVVISHIRRQDSGREIRLSYHPDNTVAAHLYERLGFRPIGELQDGEIVVRLASTGGTNSQGTFAPQAEPYSRAAITLTGPLPGKISFTPHQRKGSG
jgi:diamine N-acetyltransferase